MKVLHANGAVINTAIVMATADGIIRKFISKEWWAYNHYQTLGQLNYDLDEICKKAWQLETVANFDVLKIQFISDVQAISEFEEIPDELILKWNHTGFITFL